MTIKKDNIDKRLGLIPIVWMVFMLSVGYGYLKLPVEFIMLSSATVAGLVACYQGYSWKNIIDTIVGKLSTILPANFILILVGAMIGSWMAGGTIPALVYYGLQLISPDFILVTAFLVTAAVSLCTGTSWGSASTIGVALMGIAGVMGAPLPAVAGAVVSGAYFGDKLSPLSDSTNMAAIVTETPLYEHVRHMLWTTIPSAIVACVVFLFIGFQLDAVEATSDKVTDMLLTLDSLYSLNVLVFLPPILVLFGALKKWPTVPVMLFASLLGVFNAIAFQGFDIKSAVDAMMTGFKVAMFGLETELNADVVKLVQRGGMAGMMKITLFAFCAFAFASVTSLSGGLDLIMEKLAKRIQSVGALICSTMATTLTVQTITSEAKLPLLVTSELLGGVYKKFGLSRKNLSRTIEDAGTVTEPLMPWTLAGLFMASTLGVATLDYLPWAIVNYVAMIFAAIWGFTGIGIAPISDDEPTEKKPEQAAEVADAAAAK
ncbi:Na+/H+ antiporter NhaC [Photobacterium sanctipauli]|uniref:Na+/H+ antiporter NhaC n=1 Tax=Photobacterium sanctipauli TaxID=1342794 RepID=A0A2T3NNZ6_9GAMM|nr:Na+/H+ antiporter NhaC [Photobacterium sanctipauli]PSW17994.1 Na+/H+ antiporter NhaC [Photobacterium sanctipauli]